MNRILLIAIIVLSSSICVAQNKQVRDANGRLIESWSSSGGNTDVRDANNRLRETRQQRGNDVYVRDANGRLLRIERYEK